MTEISVAIQRGELPARTIPELVDAQRQNFAGAGADVFSLRILLERLEGTEEDVRAASEALDRLAAHLTKANAKATLAFEAAR